jgi:peptidoglycan/xylan/chitin deacetylase (PgdA/CDA1 family)
LFAQSRKVAITVDDLPYAATADEADAGFVADLANRRLIESLRTHHAAVTGFVVQKYAEALGTSAGTNLLMRWTAAGFDLGNHTYSHPDLKDLSEEQFEQEVVRDEGVIGTLMSEGGRKLTYFRFPFNSTGDTRDKHDRANAFLKQRGYDLAACTIDTSDFVFNRTYVRMLDDNDGPAAQRLREAYLEHTNAEIDYYAALNRKVLGYQPPEVMLLHDNRLNGDVIDDILRLFEAKGYEFVSLHEAQSDPAYRQPDTYITAFGPMWGYRWAAERNIKVDGRLKPEPPEWISEYAAR